MPPFLDEVAETLARELSTLERDKDAITPVVAAFSAGPDSTALLLALHKISERASIKLYACHINHNLRGEESEDDERFCEKLCARLQIPLEKISLPLESGSAPSEDLMRQFRYQALLEFARECNASFIATGHTLDDQAETMLFRLFRGTSPAGLKAMTDTRMLAEDPPVYIIRPMLKLSKADCLRFLADEGIAARVDSSNTNEHYLRNYIRWQMAPVIEARFADWKEHLGNLQQMLADDDDYFEKIVHDMQDQIKIDENAWSVQKFLALPASVQSRLIVFELVKRNIQPSYERVKTIRLFIEGADKHNALTLSSECAVKKIKENGINTVVSWTETSKFAQEESEFYDTFFGNQCSLIRMPKQPGSSVSNVITWLNKALKVDFCSSHLAQYPPCSEWQALVDLTRVTQPLYVRTRKPGDLIQPFGMQETVRLKKYLQTHKSVSLPTLGTRKSMVVVANDEEVVWVPGIGLSEKLRVHKSSQEVHKLVFNELAPDNMTWA